MPDEEGRALRDKANVALGFAALKAGKPQDARTYLQRVRLQGIEANAALLGFGWAADALGSPKLALVPWVELAGRDASDSAVLEAQLAVPYAYAELHADAQALQALRDRDRQLRERGRQHRRHHRRDPRRQARSRA